MKKNRNFRHIIILTCSLINLSFGFGQIETLNDTIPISIKRKYLHSLNGQNHYYLIKRQRKDSKFLISLYYNGKEIYKRTFALFDGSFIEYVEVDVFENGRVVPYENGMIRFLGYYDSNYTFEVIRFSREGVSIAKLSYTKKLILRKEIYNLFDRSGTLRFVKTNYYVPI